MPKATVAHCRPLSPLSSSNIGMPVRYFNRLNASSVVAPGCDALLSMKHRRATAGSKEEETLRLMRAQQQLLPMWI